MPARATPRGALAHGLELGGDLLQGVAGCRRLDAGNQAYQSVVTPLWRSAAQ